MKIEPTNEQRDYVKNLLGKDGHKMGKRGSFDGNYFERLFGLIGQVIICDEFDCPRPTDVSKPDEGDIIINGKKYDIKMRQLRGKNKKDYWNSVSHFQINYLGEGYIFLIYYVEEGVYEIAGWISKNDFMQKSE